MFDFNNLNSPATKLADGALFSSNISEMIRTQIALDNVSAGLRALDGGFAYMPSVRTNNSIALAEEAALWDKIKDFAKMLFAKIKDLYYKWCTATGRVHRHLLNMGESISLRIKEQSKDGKSVDIDPARAKDIKISYYPIGDVIKLLKEINLDADRDVLFKATLSADARYTFDSSKFEKVEGSLSDFDLDKVDNYLKMIQLVIATLEDLREYFPKMWKEMAKKLKEDSSAMAKDANENPNNLNEADFKRGYLNAIASVQKISNQIAFMVAQPLVGIGNTILKEMGGKVVEQPKNQNSKSFVPLALPSPA